MEITYITSEIELDNDLTIQFSGEMGRKYAVSFTVIDSDTEISGFPEAVFSYTEPTLKIKLRLEDFIGSFTKRSMTMKATITDVVSKEAVSANFTGKIPENDDTKPSIFAKIHTRQHSSVPEVEGDYNGVIQGKTQIRVEVTAEGKYGAAIEAAVFTVEGREYDASEWSDYISGYGEISVTAKVTDSRGLSSIYDNFIRSEPYSAPRLLPITDGTEIIAARCDAAGSRAENGTYLLIGNVKAEFSQIDGLPVAQVCSIQYRSRAADEEFGAWTMLTEDGAAGVESTCIDAGLSSEKTYYVELRAVDVFGGYSLISCILTALTPYIHWAGQLNSIGFGCRATSKDTLKVAWNVHGNALGLAGLPEIPENSDLNNFLEFGAYSVPTSTRAKTLGNTPAAEAGRLVVYSSTGTGAKLEDANYTYIAQEYHQNAEEHYYLRHIYSNNKGEVVYGSWICVNADFFVEHGSGDNYSYSRRNSGKLELWYNAAVNSTAVTTALGAWYRSDSIHCAWPITITPELINFSWTSNGGHGAVLWNTGFNAAQASFYLIRPTTDSGVSGTIHMYVVGT